MNILYLISSPRGAESYSIKLGDQIVRKLQEKYPGSTVNTRDLTKFPLPHLESIHMDAFVTPIAERSPALKQAASHSEAAIDELFAADFIVIGVPMYNFGIPSTLKTWLDHVLRSGRTFRYDQNGPSGLLLNKQAFLAISTGGVYSSGPAQSLDFMEPYLRSTLNFMGITDITIYRVEGVKIPGIQERAFEKALAALQD